MTNRFFPSLKKCKTCKLMLINGPLQERSIESGKFIVIVKNIQTKICSKGCNGIYWPHLDFGCEVFDLLDNKSEDIAGKTLGFFKIKQICKKCKVTLSDKETKDTFEFTKGGTNKLKLIITAPSL
ncbi:hypothetical protein KKH42_02445, partial [bacterium]|nr:hypothetical protein [bacterium]